MSGDTTWLTVLAPFAYAWNESDAILINASLSCHTFQNTSFDVGETGYWTYHRRILIWPRERRTNKSSGQENRLAFVRLMWSYVVLSSRCSYLDGKIVLEKSSFQTAKYQTSCSSKNLFVSFAYETIYPSGTIYPSTQFVRPLVWKRPMPVYWAPP